MGQNSEESHSDAQSQNENPGAGCGIAAAGAGCLVAFAPMFLVGGGVAGFALMFSVPIGIVIAIVGFALALGGAAAGPSAGRDSAATNLPDMMGEPRKSAVVEPHSGPPPVPEYAQQWEIPNSVAQRLLFFNVLGTIVVIVATAINMSVTLKNEGSWQSSIVGLIATGQLCAVLLAGWLLTISWRLTKATDHVERSGRFALLERIQRVIGTASIVWLIVLLMGLGLGVVGRNPIEIAAGLTPSIVGITAMTIIISIREKIESATIKEK